MNTIIGGTTNEKPKEVQNTFQAMYAKIKLSHLGRK